MTLHWGQLSLGFYEKCDVLFGHSEELEKANSKINIWITELAESLMNYLGQVISEKAFKGIGVGFNNFHNNNYESSALEILKKNSEIFFMSIPLK